MNEKLLTFIEKGCEITSSGTTGQCKTIYRSPDNLKKCFGAAVESQKISKRSSVYTVTRMTHAGGLLAQTLPALSIGAKVKISDFNPYKFLDEFSNHTHTFLTPAHLAAISKTKKFKNFNFENKRILTGSDVIDLDVIKLFVERDALVQPNWGMSEVGPIAINCIIDSLKKLEMYKRITPRGSFLLGDTYLVDYKLIDEELVIKSDMCIYNNWFNTGDLVQVVEGIMFFRGRKP